jgi:hypothetical protein
MSIPEEYRITKHCLVKEFRKKAGNSLPAFWFHRHRPDDSQQQQDDNNQQNQADAPIP